MREVGDYYEDMSDRYQLTRGLETMILVARKAFSREFVPQNNSTEEDSVSVELAFYQNEHEVDKDGFTPRT